MALYTYEHIGDREIWVSLKSDLHDSTRYPFGLRRIDTGEDDPNVTWDEDFHRFMARHLEASGLQFLRWDRPQLSANHLFMQITP